MNAERNWSRMGWGVVLVLIGCGFLAEQMNWLPPWSSDFEWWPLITIAFGLAHLLAGRTARRTGNGVMLLLLGVWFLVVTNGWYGLTWHNSWPLALVAVGMGMVTHALALRSMPDVRYVERDETHA